MSWIVLGPIGWIVLAVVVLVWVLGKV